MIAAIQIIIDVHFPVALQSVDAAIEVAQLFCQLQRCDEAWNAAKKAGQRTSVRIEIHKYKILPSIHAKGDQPARSALEITHAVELNRAFQHAVDPVRPSVRGATKLFCATL